MKKIFLAGAAATALISTAAFASVTFNSTTGTGFVGKGDIQVLYGWNNAQAQSNAKLVTFSYDATDTYDVECEWTTETGGPNSKTVYHDITVPRHTRVASSIQADPRKTGQYTGYNLSGFGTTTTEGTVPVVGGTCPGASSVAIITAVTPTGSTGGLSVTFNGVSYLLPNTPII
jgi:hypothetical protein